MEVLQRLWETVKERKEHPQEGSYTAYLFREGIDKILKKCGEECTELVVAAKNPDKERIVEETADLLYHVWVLLCERGISPEDVEAELAKRLEKQGNLKTFKTVDKNT